MCPIYNPVMGTGCINHVFVSIRVAAGLLLLVHSSPDGVVGQIHEFDLLPGSLIHGLARRVDDEIN